MTVHVSINPAEFDAEYLESLNLCFGHWGDRTQYDWAFRRSAGSHAPDQMVLRGDDGEVLAGSAVSYRRVVGGERRFEVGIMTGSWTLPAARGKGCFTRIIEESRLLSKQHGCGLLIAFVTWDNGSRRRLEEAGSEMIPSRYVFTGDRPIVAAPLQASVVDVEPVQLWRAIESSRGNALHVSYPEFEHFEGQCLERANPVEVLEVGRARVVVERTADTDRLCVADLNGESIEEVFASVAARAHRADRRFFGFAMGEHAFEGLGSKEGYLTMLVADPSALDGLDLSDLRDWVFDSGDRM